ncbi:MAG: hypothetical protein ACAI35_25850 [Candidatus Methylacidiphilales bacterium]|nr:hypothetical protein [Candidatus Methylacidiphilales bacterium]
MQADRICPDCDQRLALRECVYLESADPASLTLLNDDSTLTFYCRECFTKRGYAYRVVRPFRAQRVGSNPVSELAELPGFPAGTECLYCGSVAEVLSGSENTLIYTGDPSYLSYTGRALCKECYQWESDLFFAKVAEKGIGGLNDIEVITAEVIHELQGMRHLPAAERLEHRKRAQEHQQLMSAAGQARARGDGKD